MRRPAALPGVRHVADNGLPAYSATLAIQFSTLTLGSDRMTIWARMTEHWFLAAMLALVGLEVVVLGLVLGYFTYQMWRVLERVEGIGAATYLEIRKVLGQPR